METSTSPTVGLRRFLSVTVGLVLVVLVATVVTKQNDANVAQADSFPATPLTDFDFGELYLNTFAGLLYEDSNNPPADHDSAGMAAAANVVPRDVNGLPDSAGKVVAITMGMSNWTAQMCKQGSSDSTTVCDAETFIAQAVGNAGVNSSNVVLVNCARSGEAASRWQDDSFGNYATCLANNLTPRGLSEKQVQVVIMKGGNPGPDISMASSPGTSPADYCVLNPAVEACVYEVHVGNMLRFAKTRYVNLSQVFLQSRVYAGYAITPLNPEPYAYEYGFATKWLIQAQIEQSRSGTIDPVAGNLGPSVAPWVGWGAYLWAPGDTARSDGLTYDVEDFKTTDYTHPEQGGIKKVSKQMMNFYLTSPYTPWFRSGATVNQSPTVHAGPDTTVILPAVASLTGYVSDDNLPAGNVTTMWSVTSGPGTAEFSSPTSLQTDVTFSAVGTYVLRITADDQSLTSMDQVIVAVSYSGNQAPVANAGPDITVTLPATASLSGTAGDDGVPTPTLIATWGVVSGPGIVTFSNDVSLATQAYFSAAGVYTLRLTVSDTELSSTDDMVVTAGGIADTTLPTVSVTAPLNNAAVVPGNVTVTATATDASGINRVRFLVDNVQIGQDLSSPYSIVWNASSYPPGSVHTIQVIAVDNPGNIQSQTVSVLIAESVPPTVSITSPVNGGLVTRGATFTIAANASDNVGVTKVEFYVKNVLKCTDTIAPFSCAWPVPNAKNAAYNLHAKAFDASNNSTTSGTVNVTAK